MASAKALAAIALTLIIAVPIGLGYGLASHDVPYTSWDTSDSINVSNSILNSSTPYFSEYAGPANNSTLIRERLVTGGGYESSIISPAYVTTGSTATSLPLKISSSSTANPVDSPPVPVNGWSSTTLAAGLISKTFNGSDYAEEVTPSGPAGELFVYDGMVSISGATAANTVSPGVYTEIKIDSSFTVETNVGTWTSQAGSLAFVKAGGTVMPYGASKLTMIMPESSDYATHEGIAYAHITYNPLYLLHAYKDTWHDFSELGNNWRMAVTYAGLVANPSSPPNYLDNVLFANQAGLNVVDWYSGTGYYQLNGDDPTPLSFGLVFATGYSTTFNYTERTDYGPSDLPEFEIAKLSVNQGTATIHVSQEGQVVDYLVFDNGSPVQIIRDSDGWMINGQLYDGFTVASNTGTITVQYKTAANLSPAYKGNALTLWNIDTNSAACVKITYNDNTTEYVAVTDLDGITAGYGIVTLIQPGANQTFTNVKYVGLALDSTETSLDFTYQTNSGSYANPAYGWSLPATGGNVVYDHWINGYANGYVRMMVHVDSGESLYIYPDRPSDDSARPLVRVQNSAGTMLVTLPTADSPDTTTTALGAYEYAMIELDGSSHTVTVTAIVDGWPVMGVMPRAYNTASVVTDLLGSTFDLLYLAGGATVRVDLANVIAGYFPSTRDYTLSMDGLFPGRSYALKFNSIGVYGDSINLGSTSYGVTEGRINVGGELVPLKGAVIRSINEDGTYHNSISGYVLGDSSAPISITFGGEWSLTATADLIDINEGTREEWAPGQFAFNEDSFKGAIVLAAVAAFIGVGLYGARSGVKVGLLILICGGAALVALITL